MPPMSVSDRGRLAFYRNEKRETGLFSIPEDAHANWLEGWQAAEKEYEAVKIHCNADPRKRFAWGVQMAQKLPGYQPGTFDPEKKEQ